MIGWTSAEAHASDAELGAVVQPFVDDWRARREAEAVERWREEVGKNAPGCARAGRRRWRPRPTGASSCSCTGRAYRRRRIAPRAAAAATATTCPARRDDPERRDDGLDLAVRSTLAYGGDLLAVESR